jgi:ubiquinol-cytochrome c reductase iron-sulfur subunit
MTTISDDDRFTPSAVPGSESYANDPTHYGIEPGEPWPDDVPKAQNDMRWRYEGDPKGARIAELRIAACWTLTLLSGIALAAVYVAGGQPQVEGGFLFLGFAGLGTGMVLWARDLLPGQDVTASRGHHSRSPEESRTTVVASLGRALEPMARRPFLGRFLALVGAVFGLGVLFPLASLGPRPHRSLESTAWGQGTRLVDETGRPIAATDIEPDGILTVFPETNPSDPQGSTILINLGSASDEFEVKAQRETWTVNVDSNRIVAFSKICTHAGCPVGLYNTVAHQLVCPCHQSTFDVLSDCRPVFGPASRSLPQLPLTVDPEGNLISQSGYTEPVGPGYWNRG